MKNKSILLILFFFILTNCGFEPIHSSKKSNFNIGEIKITNKNKFNSIIKYNLKNISNNESQNKFDLTINSEKKNYKIKGWIYLCNYKNNISNIKMDINLFYKFTDQKPKEFKWHSMNRPTNEFIPSFTKKIFKKVSILYK